MSKPSLTPVRDEVEKVVARALDDDRNPAKAGATDLVKLTGRIRNMTLPNFMRALADEIDAGREDKEVLTAVCSVFANMAVAASGMLLTEKMDEDPNPGASFILKFARKIIEEQSGKPDDGPSSYIHVDRGGAKN